MRANLLRPALVALACAAMAFVEGVLAPVYPVKTGLKWLVFGGSVGLYVLLTGDRRPLAVFRRPTRAALLPGAGLALIVFVGILGGYALLRPWLDLSAVTANLGGKEGITAATFPLVALYISFGNSMLEEFFFRGFAFLTAERKTSRVWLFSALAFALYHVAIMGSWFHPIWFGLFIAGLAVAGMFFNWLDRRGTIWPAWLVHMAANLAINLIGMRMFGIL